MPVHSAEYSRFYYDTFVYKLNVDTIFNGAYKKIQKYNSLEIRYNIRIVKIIRK